MNKITLLIALGWLAVPRAVSARGEGWVKYAGNPVMGSPELGTCFDLNVVPWGSAKYNNYFSWRSQSSIALSRSEDGIHWTAPVKCLEPDPSSGWEDRINRASVWFKDGTYHMWYCGQARGYTRIGYATSKDGVRFTRMSRQPVMISERPHEGFSVMNPYVRWDEGRQVWRMWYASGETYEPNVLCYAESKDGFRWEKSPLNPVFVKGSGWDRDRVGGCEVHPLPDGRWIMFYIGYSDIHTARIGAAVSADGITGWTRLKANPLVEPTTGEWDSDACYKPSVVRESDRWLLWYNGRTASREYIGLVEHKGLDLGPLDVPHNRVLKEELVRRRFDRFALDDEELYVNAFPNRGTVWGIGRQIPLFECPDEDIERTYYFRWWTYRKHLRRTKDSKGWVVTEFLPDVSWAGAENTISCPFGHHVREGRWIRNAEYLDSYIDFMLKKGNVNGPRAYVSWPAWCALERAKVTGDLDFVKAHLDDFVRNYEEWSKGWITKGLSLKDVENAQGARGVPIKAGFRGERGLFDIAGNREGSEFALSYDGARPMVNAAMWAEATAIAEIAHASGNRTMADLFAKRAAELEQNIKARLWNADQRFFTSLSVDGRHDDVCELHGYAPFYFGMDLKGYEAAWRLLTDAQGFNAPKGLTFPARNTVGFDLSIDIRRHECLWNGPSWPYATSVALTALYGSLQRGDSLPVGAEDFAALVHQYAAQQVLTRPDGHVVPWIDENLDPMTGEWIARRHMIEWDRQGVRKLAYRERGKDYNHSTFCDLVIAGICGFVPQSDGAVVVKPLAPKSWDWWCVDGILYHGHDVTVLYDRDGTRYGRGTGLIVMQDGIRVNEGASERTSAQNCDEIMYGGFKRLQYNTVGTTDLKSGLFSWPMVMDYDGDGDLDVLIRTGGIPTWRGTWLFENTGRKGELQPVFRKARRVHDVGGSSASAQVLADGRLAVTQAGLVTFDYRQNGMRNARKFAGLPRNVHTNDVRGNVWRFADLNGDGKEDLVVGVGDWKDYGWHNSWDAAGEWKSGPLHGLIYYVQNETGADGVEKWGAPLVLRLANGKPIDVAGYASPLFADWDGDGDLDLLTCDFGDSYTYFENIGTKEIPRFATGRPILDKFLKPVKADLCMVTATVVDWDDDGHPDLVTCEEDARICLYRNTGRTALGLPVFDEPHRFQQERAEVSFGILATPSVIDWDGDGDQDIITGNSAGYVAFIENLSGSGVANPQWAEPKLLSADGAPIRIIAGPNGSIQGPCEEKWGYTCLSTGDWDGDGLPDIMLNSIRGEILWCRNVGTRTNPELAPPEPVAAEWEGPQPELAWGWMKPNGSKNILTQWRTTPYMIDLDGDGLMDLVMLDVEGYLCLWRRAQREGKRILLPPERCLVDERGQPILLAGQDTHAGPRSNHAGGSGRRKFCFIDWTHDGKRDLVCNSKNVMLYEFLKKDEGKWYFANRGDLDDAVLAGHTTSPASCDFDGDGVEDLLVGAEDGFFYLLRNRSGRKEDVPKAAD